MAKQSDYTALISREHADKPKFVAMVGAVAGALVDQQTTLSDFVPAFDLDQAVGAQLDILGDWVGIARQVKTPITGVYFTLDTMTLGLEQGVWQGPFDPKEGVTALDDDTYRLLIRAKISANRWDGSNETLPGLWQRVFGPSGTYVLPQDNQDMSMDLLLTGAQPFMLLLALLLEGYFPLKPAGVRIANYVITSAPDAPLFGFDAATVVVGGFDSGAWGISAQSLYLKAQSAVP